jgi:hypothetical protein
MSSDPIFTGIAQQKANGDGRKNSKRPWRKTLLGRKDNDRVSISQGF